ncbi:MAG TPA: HRDC domain-containing protein, partial [Methylomirabilota bacterium]|nr:HRDC domain-containing protein [Methylomirabilota bacterium]
GYLARSDAEYPTLLVTLSGHAVLRGESAAAPLTSAVTPPAASAAKAGTRIPESTRAPDTSGAADEAVFEALRVLRRKVAAERGVPPYLIFSDASLRDMARLRPPTLERFREVQGVGDWKLATFGERFVAAVRQACSASSSARE